MTKSNKIILTTLLVACVIIVAICASLNALTISRLKGNGEISTKTMTLSNFSAISINGNIDLSLTQKTPINMTVTTDSNILPYIEARNINQNLIIGLKDNIDIHLAQPIQIVINTPALQGINLNGKTVLHASQLATSSLTVNASGNSLSYLQGDIKKLKLDLSGKSEAHIQLAEDDSISLNMSGKSIVYLSGKVNTLKINVAGKTTVIAQDLIANQVIINGVGEPDITVHAVKDLTVRMVGKSSVKYYGNPNIEKNGVGDNVLEALGN